MAFFVTIGFVLFLFVGCLTALEVTYLKVVDQSKLPGNPIREQSSISEQQCLFECGLHALCRSANYHKTKQLCTLNRKRENDRNDLVKVKGWKYYQKCMVRVII